MARSYVAEARRRGLGSRRERIGPIIERLAEEHADAEIALRFQSDVELLISVMLSAQTTDVNVNRVTGPLFEKYRRPEDYLAVPVEAVFTRADVPELEAELSAAIARIQAGEFPPTPSDFACAGCPALDLVCAGPRLRPRLPEAVAS